MGTSLSLRGEQSQWQLSYVCLAIGCILMFIAYLIGINDNPPGIASMLVGFFAVILGIVYRFGKTGNRKPARQLLYWAPRVLCIVTALFISLFALDVFNEGKGAWGTTVALFLHLIPTLFILILLLVSWRREWIGGVLFIALAVLYAVSAWNKPFALSAIPLISGPLLLTGALFLLNWRYRGERRGSTT